jgi:Tol biopolymer transport system component
MVVLAAVAAAAGATPAGSAPGPLALIREDASAPSLAASGRAVAVEAFDGVYVVDVTTGEAVLASADASGRPATGFVADASLSADGMLVAFTTGARLVPGDGDGLLDVYVKDIESGAVRLASRTAAGNSAGQSFGPSLSADGTRVAFESVGGQLPRIAVKDLGTGQVFAADGITPALSADGSTVAYHSLDAGGAVGAATLAKTLETGDVEVVSTAADGTPADGPSDITVPPAVSADGARVAFVSSATNLDPARTEAIPAVYVKDRSDDSVVWASPPPADGPSDASWGSVFDVDLSDDGNRVAYELEDLSRVGAGGATFVRQIVVHDLALGAAAIASASPSGRPGGDASGAPSLSADGSLVAFVSGAANLLAGTQTPVSVYLKQPLVGTPPCTITGTDESEELVGTSAPDVICGEGGADTIRAGGGFDVVYAGPGNDVAVGGADDDALFGGRGDDTLRGLPGGDQLDGGVGTDTCTGGTGDDRVLACETATP